MAASSVIGYARLSTADQAKGLTLEQQVSRLKLAGAGEVLVDLMTGKTTARPRYRELLKRITAGEVSKVIATRWDRMCRSASETCRMVDLLTADGAPELQLLDDPQDLSTIGGRAQLRMLGVFAQMESERIRERAVAGKAFRKAKGMLDVAPFGLMLDSLGKLTPDNRPFISDRLDHTTRSRADLILEAFDQLEQGWSMYRPWRHLMDVHGVVLDRAGMNRLLMNPAFRGAAVAGRNKSKGTWSTVIEGEGGAALIDPERHKRIVATVEGLRARRATPDKRRQHVLSGKVICVHCGRKMGRATKSGTPPRYRCENLQCSYRIPQRRQNSLTEETVLQAVFGAFADQSDALAAAEERQAMLAAEQNKLNPEIQRLQEKRQKYVGLLADGDPVQSVIDTLDGQIAALLSADHSMAGMTPIRLLRENCQWGLKSLFGVEASEGDAVQLAWETYRQLQEQPWPEERIKEMYEPFEIKIEPMVMTHKDADGNVISSKTQPGHTAQVEPDLPQLIRELVREIRVDQKQISSVTLNI